MEMIVKSREGVIYRNDRNFVKEFGIDLDDDYSNAKGENLMKVVSGIGKGVVKGGKVIGKGVKVIGKGVVKGGKVIGKGVKGAFKVIGKGVKSLFHKRAPRTKTKVAGTKSRDTAPRGSTPLEHHKDDKGNDVFTKKLPTITPDVAKTMPENTVSQVAPNVFVEAKHIDQDKPVSVITDPITKEQIIGQEEDKSKVVAVRGADGNIDYHAESAGMSKGLKIGLIVGGVVLLGVILIVALKSSKK